MAGLIWWILWWWRGWFFYWRAIWKTRVKRHGAGPLPWQYCFAMGRAARYVVWGQHAQRRQRWRG